MKIFLALVILFSTTLAHAEPWYDFFDSTKVITHGIFSTPIQVGFFRAQGGEKANVVYLHGYADSMDNHKELLESFKASGLRVISFDYPSHGKSGGHISTWDLKEVAEIIPNILSNPLIQNDPDLKIDHSLPLILAGWSTGGTMAIRIAQSWQSSVIPGDMNLAGVIAFAPGLPVNLLVGDAAIVVKKETLTRQPELMRHDPYPHTTFGSVTFAKSLVFQSVSAKARYMPKNLPTLILVGDNTADQYANSSSAVSWVKSHGPDYSVYGYQCPSAYHALEFEPGGIGSTTIHLATQFASTIAQAGGNAAASVQDKFGNLDNLICPKIK